MTITIDSTDKRSVRALAVLSTADRWVRGHRKQDGRSFYAVPSASDASRVYMVDTRECTCPDFLHRGVDCAHILAVRLKVAQLTAAEPKRKPMKPAASFTRAASIGGTIAAPERVRLVALADSIWGVDGE